MDILIGTGGARSTDSFELIPQPKIENNKFSLNFFIRGLRYLPEVTLKNMDTLKDGENLLLMKDVQNPNDKQALALRTGAPPLMIGYVPKYFCSGIVRLVELQESPTFHLVQVNQDAPFDMRCLCNVSTSIPDGFEFIDGAEDFLPWSQQDFNSSLIRALDKSNLDLN